MLKVGGRIYGRFFLKFIFNMQYFSNESKAEEAQDLCKGMSEFLDTLRSEQARRVTSTQRAFMVSKSYIPLRIRVTSMCWIVKASKHISHS